MHLKPFRFFIRLCLFWLAFFAAFRLWFVLWFYKEWSPQQPLSVWKSFWYALPLDLSMLGYLMAIPAILWFLGVLLGAKTYNFFSKIILGVQFILIGAAVLVFGSNIFIFEEWHTPLNNRAVAYIATPQALLNSMSWGFQIASIVLIIGGIGLFVRVYKKWMGTAAIEPTTRRWHILFFPFILGLLVIAIRGGFGVMAINESAVYYSNHPFNNHAATNVGWYLGHSFLEIRSTQHRYKTDNENSLAELRPQLLRTFADTSGTTILAQKDGTPTNVVIILMESMTAQVIEELDGEKGVCPNLSHLIQEGVLMTHCYSSGYRTDQGLISVLAGYPAQPDQSIIVQIEKAAGLNSVPKLLKEKAGYSSALIYGSELTFANFKVWSSYQKIDPIIGIDDFTKAERTQHWGADDRIALQRAAQEISKLQQPFCATALTLSLHPPFDAPCTQKWTGGTTHDIFLNHAAFTDDALGAFFETASKQPWFNNTLFVLVADHGSSWPSNLGPDHPVTRRIPLIFYSPLLKKEWRGAKLPVFCSHHDIPASVLACLAQKTVPATEFPFSRNIFAMQNWFEQHSADKSHNFSYYTNENGLGWATPEGNGFYWFGTKQWQFYGDTLPVTGQKDARAYLHLLYEDFLQK
jgi:phosphoglycerol transferase MdoB-like AlkP superfamily enzyme